jgi:BRCA1-associated protein
MDKNARKMRGSREPQDITIETYSDPSEGPLPLLPQTQTSQTSSKSEPTSRENSEEKSCISTAASLSNIDDFIGAAAYNTSDQINFISGNPFVEITKGILHLFKEK